jgi:hypothetical protein
MMTDTDPISEIYFYEGFEVFQSSNYAEFRLLGCGAV